MVSVNALIWWFVRSRVPSSQQQKKHDNRSKWSECEKIHRFTSEQFIVHEIIRFYNKSAQNIDLWLCVFFSGGVEHFFACIPYHDIAGWCCLMFHTLWFCVIFILFVFYGWHALFCSIRCNMFAICKAFGPFCHRHFVDFTSLSASCNVLILMYFSIHFSFWKLNNLVCWTNQSSIDWDNVCVPTEIQQKILLQTKHNNIRRFIFAASRWHFMLLLSMSKKRLWKMNAKTWPGHLLSLPWEGKCLAQTGVSGYCCRCYSFFNFHQQIESDDTTIWKDFFSKFIPVHWWQHDQWHRLNYWEHSY